jgi:hypothetical protein
MQDGFLLGLRSMRLDQRLETLVLKAVAGLAETGSAGADTRASDVYDPFIVHIRRPFHRSGKIHRQDEAGDNKDKTVRPKGASN